MSVKKQLLEAYVNFFRSISIANEKLTIESEGFLSFDDDTSFVYEGFEKVLLPILMEKLECKDPILSCIASALSMMFEGEREAYVDENSAFAEDDPEWYEEVKGINLADPYEIWNYLMEKYEIKNTEISGNDVLHLF